MKVKIFKFYDDAIIPSYQTDGAAGFDLYAHIDKPYTLKPGEIKDFGTGIGVEIPKGYELRLSSRSGLSFKNHVSLMNGIGVIDSDFRNEIRVLLKNFGAEAFIIEPGMRIAQGVVTKYEQVEFEEVLELSKTGRNGGFGSTGVK